MRKKLRQLDDDSKEGLIEATEQNTHLGTLDTTNSLDPKNAFDELVANENTLQAEKVLRRAMLAAEGLIDPNIFGRWCEVVVWGKCYHSYSFVTCVGRYNLPVWGITFCACTSCR